MHAQHDFGNKGTIDELVNQPIKDLASNTKNDFKGRVEQIVKQGLIEEINQEVGVNITEESEKQYLILDDSCLDTKLSDSISVNNNEHVQEEINNNNGNHAEVVEPENINADEQINQILEKNAGDQEELPSVGSVSIGNINMSIDTSAIKPDSSQEQNVDSEPLNSITIDKTEKVGSSLNLDNDYIGISASEAFKDNGEVQKDKIIKDPEVKLKNLVMPSDEIEYTRLYLPEANIQNSIIENLGKLISPLGTVMKTVKSDDFIKLQAQANKLKTIMAGSVFTPDSFKPWVMHLEKVIEKMIGSVT